MSKNSRQNVKNGIEKYFFKLMNNANFGNDCRNNTNNVTFEPIIGEINKISYIKKYYSSFDTRVSGFVYSDLFKQEIEQTFQQHLAEVKYDDPFRNAKIAVIENQNKQECDVLEALEKEERKYKKRKVTKNFKTKLADAFKNKNTKTMIDFDRKECNSITPIALKANTDINVASRFINGKMLIFAKISLKSFLYDIDILFSY